MAGSAGSAHVYKSQIGQAFIKMAPMINPDVIRDSLHSFGTVDNAVVTESQFLNIFDEGFDKSVKN